MNESDKSKNFISDFWTLFADNRVSSLSKIVFLFVVLAYAISPIDVIPDVFLPFGIVDDGGVIVSAMFIFIRNARQQIERWETMTEEEKSKHGQVPQNNSGCVQIFQMTFALIGLLVGTVMVFITIIIISGFMTVGGVLTSIGNIFNDAPDVANVTSSRTIVTSLRPLGQVVSLSVEVAQADIAVDVATGGLNLCAHSANHVAQGAIDAGVDITQVVEENIMYDEATDTYTITLPSPQITSCRIEYIRQYERDGGNPTCGIDWDNVRLLAQYESTKLFVEDTLSAGILDRAEIQTTTVMQSFVEALTGSNVEIVYAESDEVNLPSSCQPQLPRGWVFDEEQNKWVQES